MNPKLTFSSTRPVAPAGRARTFDAADLLRAFALNAVMPVWLIGFLLKHRPAGARLRVVNLSSGAAVRAIPGMAAYCSSKAALRMVGMVERTLDALRAGHFADEAPLPAFSTLTSVWCRHRRCSCRWGWCNYYWYF